MEEKSLNKETYIWGAGHYGVLTALDLENKGIKAKGFIDTNASQIKTRIGLPVFEPNEIISEKIENLHIIIAVQNKEAVKKIMETLSSSGLEMDIDFKISSLLCLERLGLKILKITPNNESIPDVEKKSEQKGKILVYHKIGITSNDNLTVDLQTFEKQMKFLQNKKIVFLDNYDPENFDNVVIRFDDGDKRSIYYANAILKKFNYPFEVFVCGSFWNKANFLGDNDVSEILQSGGRLQYHTHTLSLYERNGLFAVGI